MLKSIFIKISQGIFEYLLLFPVFLIIGINIIDDSQLSIWLFCLFALFSLGAVFRSLFYKGKWWLFSFFAVVVGVSSSFFFAEDLLFIIAMSVIHTLIVYRGMMYVSQTWQDVLPLSFLWIGGLGTYFVGYFIFRFVESLNPYSNYITIFGIILIVMIMFASNSDHLKNTTLSKEKKPFVSKAIKNQNRIFLMITILIIALITNGQMIRDGLWNAFRAVIRWLIEFLSGSGEKEIIEEAPPQAPMEPVFPFEEPKEPSMIAKFLEIITMYIMYIVLAFAVVFILLLFIKKTRMWMMKSFRQIIQFLKQIVSQITERDESTQYVEEKESVFDWQEWKDEQQLKAKGIIKNVFKRKPSWNALSNQQKVRFVFKNFLLKEIDVAEYRDNVTPREILEKIKSTAHVDDRQLEQLRKAYEQTRYGEQDIDEQIINEIYTLINKK